MKPIEEILEPYNERLKNTNYADKEAMYDPTVFLFQKWAYRVGKGWYGFDLEGTPMVWGQAINAFLRELEVSAPNFEIHQIKLKFGGLRFYVDLKLPVEKEAEIDFINDQIEKLCIALYNEKLIY